MSATTCYSYFDSPVGRLFLQGDDHFLTGLYLPNHKHWSGPDARSRQTDSAFVAVRDQLGEYFAGVRREFELPLRLDGTPFQQRVWQELVRIPFGETISYGELAARLGQASASRAVGSANGRNPISIIVPCHRVIGASGKLTGYGGGLDNKRWLLDWESRATGGCLFAREESGIGAELHHA